MLDIYIVFLTVKTMLTGFWGALGFLPVGVALSRCESVESNWRADCKNSKI